MHRVFVTLTLTCCVLSAQAQAQAQTAGEALTRDRDAVSFEEVERGFYFGLTGGALFWLSAPGSGSSDRPFSPGMVMQAELGFDIADRASIALMVLGAASRAGAEYTGYSNGLASGDFLTLMPGAVVRVNTVGFDDVQAVRRFWIYLRAGGGYAFFSPRALLPEPSAILFGGPGVEYYTRLRHFSVGLEATGVYMLQGSTIGFTIAPNLRYAF